MLAPTLLAGALAAVQAAEGPLADVPPVIPADRHESGTAAGPRLVRYLVGPTSCGARVETPLLSDPPLPAAAFRGPAGEWREAGELHLRFRIDSAGRPLGLRMEPSGAPLVADPRDVIAAVASWRFASGAERSDCRLKVGAVASPVESTDLQVLHRYLALVLQRMPGADDEVSRAAADRVMPAGSTCRGAPLHAERWAIPFLDRIEQAPGTLSYSFLAFDIDGRGRSLNVRILSSSGNRVLDRASIAAVRQSLFSPVARKGCTKHYYNRQERGLEPPPGPAPVRFRLSGATCPVEAARKTSRLFPGAFHQRGIEGWAIVRYDVAPSGRIVNSEAVAAEPAEPFGGMAELIVADARRPASAAGWTGCVTRLDFQLLEPGELPPLR